MQQAAETEARGCAQGSTDVGLVLHIGVELAAAVDDTDAAGDHEGHGAGERDQLVADAPAAGEDVRVLALIAQPVAVIFRSLGA